MAFTADKSRCENEDAAGVLCCYGPGHACPCRFKPIDLTDAQYEKLDEIGRFTTRQFTCTGLGEVATLKALGRRGLVTLRYVNSRGWDATLLPAGRRVLFDRPR